MGYSVYEFTINQAKRHTLSVITKHIGMELPPIALYKMLNCLPLPIFYREMYIISHLITRVRNEFPSLAVLFFPQQVDRRTHQGGSKSKNGYLLCIFHC